MVLMSVLLLVLVLRPVLVLLLVLVLSPFPIPYPCGDGISGASANGELMSHYARVTGKLLKSLDSSTLTDDCMMLRKHHK